MLRIFVFVLVVNSLVFPSAYAEVPDAVKANRSAVVTIFIYEKNKQVSSGSGFIIDAGGKVVTNAHVISELNKGKDRSFMVKMDNGSWLMPGDVLISDTDMDVAIFSVSARNLPILKLARNYVPKEGEDVYVIGSPMGLETSFSSGIISSIRGSDGFLQITAPISSGSSGSPVFNSIGEVIGIATMIMKESQNLNFAVPIKYVYLLSEGKKKKSSSIVSGDQSVKEASKGKEVDKPANSNSETQKLLQRLSELTGNGKYEEAADLVTQLLEKKQDCLTYYIRAIIYIDWIDFVKKANFEDPIIIDLRDKAINDLTKAIELTPNFDPSYYQLAKVMHENAGKDLDYPLGEKDQTKMDEYYQRRKQFNVDVLRFINKAITLDPAKADYYWLRSLVYGTQNDNYMAIGDMSSAISLNSKSSQYYFRRGYLYCETQQKALARRDYIKAMDISGESAWLSCFDASEKNDIYTELIKRHKNNSVFHLNRSYALNDMSLHERALADVNLSIKLKKNSSNVELRGKIYQAMGKFQNAINDYSAVLSGNLEGDYVNRYNLLKLRSICHYVMGNLGPAFADMNDSCKVKDSYYAFGEDSCEMAKFLQKELVRGKKWTMLSGPSIFNRDVTKSFYYDKTSVRRKSNGHYLSWFRMEESKESKIENMKKSGDAYRISKYNDYSHSLMLLEINCTSMSLGEVSSIDYDTEGNTIYSYSPNTIRLTTIVPESYGESACRAICKGGPSRDKSITRKKKR